MRTHSTTPAATRNQAGVTDFVSEVLALSREDLMARWSGYYGNLPPKSISTRLLTFAIAYAMQVERHGGLSNRSQKELLRLASAQHEFKPSGENPVSARRKRSAHTAAAPTQGTRFVREWNGKSHVVEVLDKGFAWQGKTYRSLSAIATTITGSRWSGPRFFGLK